MSKIVIDEATAKLVLEALDAALSDDQPHIEKSKQAITALREALALDFALAEAEAENKLLRARNERLNKAVADEREACAQVCDDIEMKSTRKGPADCAAAIRARGNT